MELAGAVVVVTGAAGGIGAAMARRFAAEGARALVLGDLEPPQDLAADVRAAGAAADAVATDVRDAAAVQALVHGALDRYGRIDLLCSNAGVATGSGLAAGPELWQRAWEVNVMAHVHGARAVLPSMLRRGSGHLLNTCSAAGLLTSPGDAPYAATKHAAVALAEWLALTYGDRGIRVSALCPLGVATPMLLDGLAQGNPAAQAVVASGEVLRPEQVADDVVRGLREERLLILPHPQVAGYAQQRAADPDRWLAGLRRLLP